MNELKYEDLKKRVYDELDSISSKSYERKRQFETAAFILSIFDKIGDSKIVDANGMDRTAEFKRGLNNILKDPLGAPKVFLFEPCDNSYLKLTPEGYSRYCTNNQGGDNFKIINQLSQEEVGRLRITVMEEQGELICYVTFLEFKDKYKGKFFISDVMKDCVVSEYGPRFRWAVHENFLGKEVPRNAR